MSQNKADFSHFLKIIHVFVVFFFLPDNYTIKIGLTELNIDFVRGFNYFSKMARKILFFYAFYERRISCSSMWLHFKRLQAKPH